ncbi:MAG: hypothetical protein LBI19_01430 [Oscillospiraceae bacterium]|jgi:hypothetical protein|nr:hypothetical protein [Oscillospiraceae bacterium]
MDSFNPMSMQMDFADRMERLYPETAAMIAPHTRDLVDALDDDAVETISSADIARMADEAARRSGMASNMPAGHNPGTLGDLTRALVVRELIDRHRHRRHGRHDGRFPFFPFFFFPFDNRDFRHFHGFDRDFGHHRRHM